MIYKKLVVIHKMWFNTKVYDMTCLGIVNET